MAEGFNIDYKKRKLNQDSEEQQYFTKEQIFQIIDESIDKRLNARMHEIQRLQLQGPSSGDLITHVKSYDRELSNNDLIEIEDGPNIILDYDLESHSHLKEKISELKETWSSYLFNEQTKERNVVPVFNSKGEQKGTKPLNECYHQHPLFEDIMLDLMEISAPSCRLDIYHYSAYQGQYNRPDFMFVKKDWPLKSAFCSFAVELQLGEIDKEHLGRIKSYNTHVLQSAPMRSFIISAVSNFEEMVLFETKRKADGTFKHTRYFPVDFWTRGIEYLHYMINEPRFVGFDDDSLAFNLQIESKTHYITSILGRGRTACVFRFQPYIDAKFEPSNYAVKVFEDKSIYEREKELNNELTKRFEELKKSESIDSQLEMKTSDMFIYQVVCIDSHNAIVYEPVGEKLGQLTPVKIDQIFKAVRSLHRLEIIHRDLSPNHFYQFNDKILIIDFGCAVFVEHHRSANATSVRSFRGSIHFAAREILEFLCEKKGDYKPQRWHDLESVVRSLMFIYHELTMPKMPDCTHETVKDVTYRVIMYWELVDQHLDKLMNRFWREALEIVRVRNDEEIFDVYSKLEKHFEKLPNRYVNNQAILDEFNKIN